MAPFGFGKSEEEKQAEALAEQRAAAAMAAIERGGIPPEAERRLNELRAAGGLFTSTLTANDAAIITPSVRAQLGAEVFTRDCR